MEVPESGGTPAFVKKKVMYVNFTNMGGNNNSGNQWFAIAAAAFVAGRLVCLTFLC